MDIQVHTDNHVKGSERLTGHVEDVVRETLDRFADRITRVEVFLHDDNAHKGGDHDKRCVIESRLAGLQPITVSAEGPNLDVAIDNAADKMEKTLRRTTDKLGEHKGRISFAGEQDL